MLFIIGLGLNNRGISKEGLLALEKCKKVYLDGYTVDFPYELIDLKLSKRIFPLKRGEVESNRLIDEETLHYWLMEVLCLQQPT